MALLRYATQEEKFRLVISRTPCDSVSMESVSDIIALWPSPEEFAADIDVAVSLVRVWKFRKSIPAERWAAITAAAKRRDITEVTADELVRLAAKDPLPTT